MSEPALRIVDEEQHEIAVDASDAAALLAATAGLEAATVSACPDCHSRVIAAVALVDLIDAAPPFPRARELQELADEAPTLHLYVQDLASRCRHRRWLDPGHTEWAEALAEFTGPAASR